MRRGRGESSHGRQAGARRAAVWDLAGSWDRFSPAPARTPPMQHSAEIARIHRVTRPFGHARLAAFFLVLALLAGLAGARLGPLLGAGPGWSAGLAAGLCALLGFAGVLAHRLRTSRIRWRETAAFLERIRSESERYRALLEGAADMLLVVEPASGRLRECNALARTTLGIRAPAEGAGLLAELLEPGAAALLAELASAASSGATAELSLRSSGGERLLVAARSARIRSGEEELALLSLRDVTAERAMQRELSVRERLSSIGMMTAGVAHDLANPLAGIANYLSLLGRPGLSEEARARYLARVEEGIGRIRGLAQELLRFARPQGEERAVALSEIVGRALHLASFAPDVQRVRVETSGIDESLHVLGDAGRLEQVVFNLLTNAGAALRERESGRIELSARSCDAPGGSAEVELVVADDGPGIAPEDLERIFDPFFSRSGGAGIGLALCCATVAAHGGRLSAANRPEGGAELRMRLPAAPRAPRSQPGEEERAPPSEDTRGAAGARSARVR